MKIQNVMSNKLSVLVVFLFLVAPATSFAQVVFDYVGATDCAPVDFDAVKKLELVDGSWVFRGREKGAVTLECHITMWDHHSLPGKIGYIMAIYGDSDGADQKASASFSLIDRRSSGVTNYGGFESYSSSGDFYVYPGGEYVVGWKFYDVDTDVSDFWYVRVDLYRYSDDYQVGFQGLFITD